MQNLEMNGSMDSPPNFILGSALNAKVVVY